MLPNSGTGAANLTDLFFQYLYVEIEYLYRVIAANVQHATIIKTAGNILFLHVYLKPMYNTFASTELLIAGGPYLVFYNLV